MKYTNKNSFATICKSVFLAIFISAFCSCKDEVIKYDGYAINGTVTGKDLDSAWVKLSYFDYEEKGNPKIIDSVQVQDGKFQFKGNLDTPDRINLKLDNYFSSFFLENGEIDIELDLVKNLERNVLVKPIVKGSKNHDAYTLYDNAIDSILHQNKFEPLNTLRAEGDKAFAANDPDLIKVYREKRETLVDLSDMLNKEIDAFKYQYIKDNPNSAVAPYLIGRMGFTESYMTHDELKEYYNLFKGDAQQTAMYKLFTKTYKTIFEELAIGKTAPNFTLKTIEGNDLTLSEIKGKYIYVDFWASWCKPCRASFPHLKELYKKYHKDGFEVVGIATLDEEAKWKKAIAEDETPWHHVFDKATVVKPGEMGAVGKLYKVAYLPTTFILDENKVFVGRNLTEDELDKKLLELFGY